MKELILYCRLEQVGHDKMWSLIALFLKLATFLQPLEVLYLHNVHYLKLSLIILIYYVTFTDLILEKGFMKVENVRIEILYELK